MNGAAGAGVTGLLYGDPRQLVAQVIGIVANVVWVGASSYALFKVIDLAIGMRSTPEQEMQGLDFNEVSAPAYPGEGSPVHFPVFASAPVKLTSAVLVESGSPAGAK